MPQGDEESVLARLGTATWSSEDGVAYEVALDGINQVVGAYSALIGREEAAPTPDAAAIESWLAAQRDWAGKRRQLSPADRAGVDEVRAACSALLAQMRGGR